MRIVVDSDRIMSALIKDSVSRAIITSAQFEFYTLEYVIEGVMKYKNYIVKKSTLNKKEITLLFALLVQNVSVISDAKVKRKMNRAIEIMSSIDVRDAPILACALAINNDGIWTEDRHFEKQNAVKVHNTKDLLSYLKNKKKL